MNAIDALFQRLRGQGRKAFMPFLTAGDPDLSATRKLIHELAANGADLVEIGFPYSDPIADGPVIQASYTRALGKKIKRSAPKPEATSVTVLNGNGVVGSASTASYELGRRGYKMVTPPSGATGNAPRQDYFQTTIYYNPAKPSAQARPQPTNERCETCERLTGCSPRRGRSAGR